ncbi:hypothetical protein QP248_02750 [Aerococcus sp. UMB8608]|uniref:Uncharacterized protein n=1 Tax=Aerococcus sanguinicola TaxID=119206 RepID=A0A0X8F9W0_9LACT|nr:MULTISPECIES: hypothetical protein [Aerococcus]AMB93270.1 hypothetical protein AWM72_00040 [Aerococcus sanguinicola]MDK6679369.1 hypothetical protein [Aerococcus sp. UMB8608]MDK6685789.1 hypothetical protein [Aerococcus sp. UMB8623]OFT95902.1 hypothetical protein HMPREF3090_03520 [Aerococcus sp. HMSC23C02]
MKAEKWNIVTKEYEPYELPEGRCSVYEDDMNRRVVCAQCGQRMLYGESYCSKEIHTSVGFGYAVCDLCYRLEWQRIQVDIENM